MQLKFFRLAPTTDHTTQSPSGHLFYIEKGITQVYEQTASMEGPVFNYAYTTCQVQLFQSSSINISIFCFIKFEH